MDGLFVERATYTLQFKNCTVGLGLKVIGGVSEEEEDDFDFGIFIKNILSGGVACLDGRLREGDQILQVNQENLEKVTNDHAVTCLRLASASDLIELVICRDEQAREEYLNLLNNYSYSSASSVYEQSSHSSTNQPIGSKGSWGIPEGQAQSSEQDTPINSPRPASAHLFRNIEQEEAAMPSPRMRPRSSPPYQHHAYMDGSYLQPHLRYNMVSEPSLYHGGGASVHHKGLLVAPDLHSTPQYGVAQQLKYSPPDGASGNSHNGHTCYEPSPLTASDSYLNRSPAMFRHSPSAGRLPSGIPRSRSAGLTRKPTLDSFAKLPVEKLEVALHYLGLHPTEHQQVQLRRRLRVDEAGMVSYGEFVSEARSMFRFELEERGITPGALYIAAEDAQAYADNQYSVPNSARSLESEIQRIRLERNQLRLEITRLKTLLKEQERSCNSAEEQLLRVRKEAQGAIHESRAMRSKVQLAESAQWAARTMEHDYIEVVSLLEAEIAQLKVTKTKQVDNGTMRKRNTVLSCQLRKTELGRKTLEVTTEKLLQFAQLVHDRLSSREMLNCRDVEHERQKKATLQQLATEARDTVKAVRALLESELT